MRRAVVVLALLSAPVLATALRPFAGMRGDASLGGNTPNGSPLGAAAPAPVFDLQAGSTTPNDLPDSLTVNSVPMTLVLACDADDVSGINWTCRTGAGNTTLAEAGTGSSPSNTINTPFHALDSTERGSQYVSGGKRHDASSSTVADLTTDDLVFEYVGKLGLASGAVILDKGLAGTDGWQVVQSGTSAVRVSLRTASTTTSVTTTGGVPLAYGHTIAFIDRSEASTNGAIAYLNGAAGTGVDMSARSGSLTNASTMAVGAASGATANNALVGSFRVWRCAGCMAGGATNPTQWAAIARERTGVAFGVNPAIAAGTRGPTTLTRATTAYVDVVDGNVRHLYLAGNGAPRVSRRSAAGVNYVGFMSEPAVSNIALQSETLQTTWAAITVGDNVLQNAFAGADLATTGDNIDGNNSVAEHGLRQSITLTATTHTFSAWAKTGTQTWVALRNATIANGVTWFDVGTCTSGSCAIGTNCASAVGTQQAGVSRASAERYPVDTTGDGVADVDLCRVSITYAGTAAPHNHDLLCAPSNGLLSYLDVDATADCGFWGVRVEAFPTPTSYLATTTGSTARNADDVRYDGASHYTGSPSTMDVAVLCPTYDIATTSTFASVGSSASSYARAAVNASDFALLDGLVTTAQWSIAGSVDIADGAIHSLRQTMATNAIEAFVDNVSIGVDTSANLPATASSFVYLGSTGGTAAASACLLRRVRLWSSIATPAVAP